MKKELFTTLVATTVSLGAMARGGAPMGHGGAPQGHGGAAPRQQGGFSHGGAPMQGSFGHGGGPQVSWGHRDGFRQPAGDWGRVRFDYGWDRGHGYWRDNVWYPVVDRYYYDDYYNNLYYNTYYNGGYYVANSTVVQPVVTQPVVVQQPTVVATQPVQTPTLVWIEGRYVNQVQANGTVLQVWQPGHYEQVQPVQQIQRVY